jgi:putative Mg2+ transporter-C (MgtC) family protein
MDIAAFAMNVGAALLMGLAIGTERQIRQHTAGLRTNALVCVGAALFVALSSLVGDQSSPTRIAGQVVSGIGFLGGGVILREGFNVRGMNTAATLWCSGAVGSLAGAGHLAEGAIGTVTVLFIHLALRPVVRRIEARTKTATEVETQYRVRVVCNDQDEGVIRLVLMRHVNAQQSMIVQGISLQDTEESGRTAVVAEIQSSERNDRYLNELVSRLSLEPSVTGVSWERVG